MNSVLSALMNGMVVSVGLAFVAWIALRLTPGRLLNAATRYAIWWAVMAATVALPVAYLRLPSGGHVVEVRYVPVSRAASRAAVAGATRPSAPVAPHATPQPSVRDVSVRASGRSVWFGWFHVILTPGGWAARIVFAWIGLALLMLARLVASIAMLERRKMRASEVPGLLAERVAAFLCSRRDVRVASSPEIPIPMAAGPWWPSILLPSQLIETLSERELEQIGIHEAGHFARYDDYALLAQRAIETALVLNPVAWWVSRQIDLEREIACDDLVVAATGDAQPYAACLARVVELSGAVQGMPMAAAAVEDRSHLAKRVAMLLDRTRNHGTRLGRLRLAMAAVCVAAISWGAVQNRGFVTFASAPAQRATVLVPQPLLVAQVGQGGVSSAAPPAVSASGTDRQIGEMPQREKELIAATFRQEADKAASAQQTGEVAARLATTQAQLHYLAVALSLELQLRELRGETQADSELGGDLMAAVDAMRPAVEQLQREKWNDAVQNEQRALQALLRAEASDHQSTAHERAAVAEQHDRQPMSDFAMREFEDLARRLRLSSQMNDLSPTDRMTADNDELLAERMVKGWREGGGTSASVYVPAEVRDPMGRFVTGLDRDAFGVREDGVEQHITDILGNEEPPDIFVVTDWRYPAGADFSKVNGNVTPYQTESGKVLDTVRMMSQLSRTRRVGRKVAMIVAGSSENIPNYSEAELRTVLAGLGMPAFVFVVAEPGTSGQAGILNEIASRSGGRCVPVPSAGDVAAAVDQALPEVKNLYFLGYAPSNAAHDGNYRNVQVTIQAPRGLPPLTVHSALGYVAVSQ